MTTAAAGGADDEATAVVDTHVHLWDLARPGLTWDWVDTDADHPVLGRIDSVKARAYEMADLEAEARFAGVAGFVHVQAAIGSADPVEETRWLTEVARAHPLLRAVVGHADLAGPGRDAQLAGHAGSPLFRGVRDFAVEPYLAAGEPDRRMEAGLAALARHDLVLDLDCEHPNMAAARAMAARHPDLTVVLEHIGFPRRRDAEYHAAWRVAVAELAREPNVVCKLSGLAMTDRAFTRDSLRPWVRHCIDVFGPDRIMMGSNWPLDRLGSSYDALFRELRALVAEDAPQERRAMLRGTAERTYRLAT